jgi:general secretion pathway protein E
MGVEPFLVAGTVEGIMAQRLLRRLCAKLARRPILPKQEDLPNDFPWEDCSATTDCIAASVVVTAAMWAITGRMGIYELLVTNEQIKTLAHDRVSTWEIKKAALNAGMRTLRMDAWDKAIAGNTSDRRSPACHQGRSDIVSSCQNLHTSPAI